MERTVICRMAALIVLGSFLTAGAGIGFSAEKADMGGWEKDGTYDRYYDVGEMDEFKGRVQKVKTVVPLAGMSPAVALEVRLSDSEVVLVHVCPVWFADIRKIGIKKGDRVKVRGAWAEIEGTEVFMASKIKKGDQFEFKVRLTKDGTPFWTMSPEELARERAASQSSVAQ